MFARTLYRRPPRRPPRGVAWPGWTARLHRWTSCSRASPPAAARTPSRRSPWSARRTSRPSSCGGGWPRPRRSPRCASRRCPRIAELIGAGRLAAAGRRPMARPIGDHLAEEVAALARSPARPDRELPGFARSLRRLFARLRRGGVRDGEPAAAGVDDPHLVEVLRLYGLWRARIAEFYDEEDLLDAAAEAVEQEPAAGGGARRPPPRAAGPALGGRGAPDRGARRGARWAGAGRRAGGAGLGAPGHGARPRLRGPGGRARGAPRPGGRRRAARGRDPPRRRRRLRGAAAPGDGGGRAAGRGHARHAARPVARRAGRARAARGGPDRPLPHGAHRRPGHRADAPGPAGGRWTARAAAPGALGPPVAGGRYHPRRGAVDDRHRGALRRPGAAGAGRQARGHRPLLARRGDGGGPGVAGRGAHAVGPAGGAGARAAGRRIPRDPPRDRLRLHRPARRRHRGGSGRGRAPRHRRRRGRRLLACRLPPRAAGEPGGGVHQGGALRRGRAGGRPPARGRAAVRARGALRRRRGAAARRTGRQRAGARRGVEGPARGPPTGGGRGPAGGARQGGRRPRPRRGCVGGDDLPALRGRRGARASTPPPSR